MENMEFEANNGLMSKNGGGYCSSKKRDKKIDLLKGMGIILMVFRHTEAPYSEFVLLFHMAIFFIASGYLFNPKKIMDFKGLVLHILKKIRSLWLPYFAFNTLFIALHNVFLRINFITDNPQYLTDYKGRYAVLYEYYKIDIMVKKVIKGIFFMGSEQLGGAMWFFQALFLLTIGYAVIEFILRIIIKDEKYVLCFQSGIAVIFLIIGYYLHIKGKFCYGLNRFFSFYCLFFIGQLFRINQAKLYSKIKSVNLFLITLISIMLLFPFGHIDLSGNNIENPIYFIVVSLFGWFMMYSLAMILEEKNLFINGLIEYISKRSVSIVSLHFLAFKLVNCIAVEFYNMPTYMRAGFPVIVHSWWCLLYLIIGITFPLLIDGIYIKCRHAIMSN